MKTLAIGTTVVVAFALSLLSPISARAQAVVEQTIRVGSGDGTMIQLPPGLGGGQRQFKTGTGRIRGRVLASDSGGPIRRAQVRISGSEVAPKAALTDAEGRFEFRELPAGRFTLQASKSGYVSVQYGQTRPFESGKPIELADKQILDGANISMPRGGVISGRIVDEFGDPLPDVSVTAMRQSWSNGRRRLTPAAGRIGQTNDLGQYRIYGLPPGDYYISATLRGGGLEMAMMDMEVMMVAGASVSGPAASAPRSGYAATYYPGTTTASEAQRITLAPGQEASSADFPLAAVRLARVTGIVIGSDGKPLEGVAISASPASRDVGLMMAPSSARSQKDGSFTLNSVPPGDYTLQARTVQVITSPAGDNMMVFRSGMIGGGGESEFGSMPLTVAGEDISNVLLTTTKGGTAQGQVTFDGARPPTATSIRVTSMAADADGSMPSAFGSVKEDGSFELKGVAGTRLIRIAGAPPGWILKSVKLHGNDITDTGTEFKAGEVTSGLEIELTNRSTAVTGGVTGRDGTLLKDYTVVIFSDAPESWRFPMTRWVTGTRPDQDGRFKVQNLPPGNYIAVAVDYIPQGEWGDPEQLDRLRPKGQRFVLAEGATHTLELKLTDQY
jgi:hypothetical protein